MPLNRPSPKTLPYNQKLRLYLAYNRSYDSLNFLNNFWTKIFWFFRTNQLNFKIKFSHPKRHFLVQNHVVWRIKCENRPNGLVCGGSDETKKSEVNIRRFWVISRMWGAKTPGQIDPKIFSVVYVRALITCFKFGDDHFRDLASAEGHILPFPIDFDGRPYNTLTLPCERVIHVQSDLSNSSDNFYKYLF